METIAIGLYCKKCQTQADIHHAYLDKGKLYIQGPCPECGEDIRFSCDELHVSLIQASPRTEIRVN